MSDERNTPKSTDEEGGWEFRCMWCNSDSLVYLPFIVETDGYIVETPEGEEWVTEYEEEGYLCQNCGTHCNVEEVYWWHPTKQPKPDFEEYEEGDYD